MGRMKMDLPDRWTYEHQLSIRVTDLNYGAHLANQNILVYAQEARMAFFKKFGQTELKFGEHALIQADAAIIFKAEGFYGDELVVKVSAVPTGNSAFNVYYLIQRLSDGQDIAHVRTAMICFDYDTRKPVKLTDELKQTGLFLID
jgi:acyl-CoA thioesterase FadM